MIASRLLARDLLQRGVLAAPFEMALPGANYYPVTTEETAQRPISSRCASGCCGKWRWANGARGDLPVRIATPIACAVVAAPRRWRMRRRWFSTVRSDRPSIAAISACRRPMAVQLSTSRSRADSRPSPRRPPVRTASAPPERPPSPPATAPAAPAVKHRYAPSRADGALQTGRAKHRDLHAVQTRAARRAHNPVALTLLRPSLGPEKRLADPQHVAGHRAVPHVGQRIDRLPSPNQSPSTQ